jgi:hypothetical protein
VTTGIGISLARQLIHTGLGALEPGHLFTELEDMEWTLWGQWTDFAETYGGPASITSFSLLCLRLLTWAGGLFCQCVALSELYKWTTTGLAACFPSFISKNPQRTMATDSSTWPATAHMNDWSSPEKLTPPSLTPSRTSTSSYMVPAASSIPRS